MQVGEYRDLTVAKAQKALETETDVATLRALGEQETRLGIRAAVRKRLTALGLDEEEKTTTPEVVKPGPTLVPAAETTVPTPEEELPPEPEGKSPSKTRTRSAKGNRTRVLKVTAPDVALVWTCKHTGCTHEGPPEDFGWRTVSGRKYRQPWCRPCRRASSKDSRLRKKEAAANKTVETAPL